MPRTLLCAALLSLSLGGLAHAVTLPAQDADAGAASPGAPSSAAPAAAVSKFTPGMPVLGPSGERIGVINRVGQTADGIAAAEVIDTDGRPLPFAIAALTLAPSRDHVISKINKAEAKAQAAPERPER